MSDQAEKFREELEDIFKQLPLLPAGEIKGVHSADYAEDGRSFVVLLDLQDGGTMVLMATPGEPLSVKVQTSGSGRLQA